MFVPELFGERVTGRLYKQGASVEQDPRLGTSRRVGGPRLFLSPPTRGGTCGAVRVRGTLLGSLAPGLGRKELGAEEREETRISQRDAREPEHPGALAAALL